MEPATQDHRADGSLCPPFHTITTTLYELVEAISEELEPGEDWMISAALVDLTKTGRIRFLGKPSH